MGFITIPALMGLPWMDYDQTGGVADWSLVEGWCLCWLRNVVKSISNPTLIGYNVYIYIYTSKCIHRFMYTILQLNLEYSPNGDIWMWGDAPMIQSEARLYLTPHQGTWQPRIKRTGRASSPAVVMQCLSWDVHCTLLKLRHPRISENDKGDS